MPGVGGLISATASSIPQPTDPGAGSGSRTPYSIAGTAFGEPPPGLNDVPHLLWSRHPQLSRLVTERGPAMHRAAAVSGIHRARGEGDQRLDKADE